MGILYYNTYIFKLLNIVVGEHICFLQVLLLVKRFSNEAFPKRSQQIQRKGDICPDGYAKELTKKVQQLFFCIADGAGSQDVLPLKITTERTGRIKFIFS